MLHLLSSHVENSVERTFPCMDFDISRHIPAMM